MPPRVRHSADSADSVGLPFLVVDAVARDQGKFEDLEDLNSTEVQPLTSMKLKMKMPRAPSETKLVKAVCGHENVSHKPPQNRGS